MFQKKVLQMRGEASLDLSAVESMSEWRRLWEEEIKKWHSPFKALIDLRDAKISEDLDLNLGTPQKALKNMIGYFSGLYLTKVIFLIYPSQTRFFLPEYLNSFSIEARCFVDDEAGALASLGLGPRDLTQSSAGKDDLRSSIQLLNDFSHNTIELSFRQNIRLADRKDVLILQSKISNNLMQWHNPWNLLVDCSGLTILLEAMPAWERMIKYLKGLHMQRIIGYGLSPQGDGASAYPFPVFRSRHIAASKIKTEQATSGDAAQCKSRV